MLLQPGSLILDGKYRVEAFAGRGASAEVYRVLHVALRAQRAVKVLRRGDEGVGSTTYGDYRRRFEFEAQLGAQLNHPNIIHVYDFAEQEGEVLLLVTEFAPGGGLADRLTRQRETGALMPIEEAVGIATDVANGLARLHARDIVHRDIKPNNILFDADGHAKIADLGLAQNPGGPSLRSQLSQALPHPGTPAYMSPEQVNSSAYLTPASDVYSLGLVLFEMLTGRAYKNVRPGTRVSSLRPGILTGLDNLLARMLDENPQTRPFDGAETAQQLREAAMGVVGPTVAPVPGTRPAAVSSGSATEAKLAMLPQSPAQRKSWVLPAIGLGVLVLLAAGVIALLRGPSLAPSPPSPAAASAPTQTSEATLSPAPSPASTSAAEALTIVPTNTPQPAIAPTDTPIPPPTNTPLPPPTDTPVPEPAATPPTIVEAPPPLPSNASCPFMATGVWLQQPIFWYGPIQVNGVNYAIMWNNLSINIWNLFTNQTFSYPDPAVRGQRNQWLRLNYPDGSPSPFQVCVDASFGYVYASVG